MTTPLEAYRAALTGAVFLDRSDRIRLNVSGPDRAKFLHNLTTNEVKRLPVGQGAEAFVTSPQGKTLGYVTLLVEPEIVVVRTDPNGAELLVPHLQKYGIFDDVTLDDASERTFEFHLAGPMAEGAVAKSGVALPEAGELSHIAATLGGVNVRIVREAPLGVDGLTILGPRTGDEAVRAALREVFDWIVLDPETADALRIEAGTPQFGRDVNADNLPQEVARDDRAINFVKGCYLGQETVARIDALGHVNKRLRGLRIDASVSTVPASGATIEADGKTVGAITSAAFSAGAGAPVALGYVRTAHDASGTPVRILLKDGSSLPAVLA